MMIEANPALRHAVAVTLTCVLSVATLWLTLTPQDLPDNRVLPFDKIAHVLAFAALILPTAWAYPRALVVTLPLALAMGGAIELLQPMVGRGRELADFLADVLGVGLGLLVGTLLRRRGRSRAGSR